MPEPLAITDRMRRQVESWQTTADRREIFLNCYTLMTANMLTAIEGGEFNDPEWVYSLLHHFAGYYFNALDAYENQNPDTPPVWSKTFDSARDLETLVLQNLLLGINAHINYDLIFTLADMLAPDWVQLSLDERQGRYDDHCHVNDVIARTIDAVQDTVVEPISPAMRFADALFGPLDEWVVSRLITAWREDVWANALRLLDASGEAERQQLRQQYEGEALERTAQILRI